MSWTVACFCGNIYTPPDCCEVCGRLTAPASPPTPATRPSRSNRASAKPRCFAGRAPSDYATPGKSWL
jgi:hypothetical protein